MAEMAGITIVFDFDRTIIDGDSDNLVVTRMGLTDLFNELYSSLPWNSLMVGFFIFHFLPSLYFSSQLIDCYSIDGIREMRNYSYSTCY